MQDKIILPNSFLSIAEEELKEGKNVKILADGISMYPFIHGGKDISEIEPLAEGAPLKIWHVYMFRYNGKYIIHRLVSYHKGDPVFEGDGNLKITEQVERNDVIGHLINIHHRNGNITDCTTDKWIKKGVRWHKAKPYRRYLLAMMRRLYKYKLLKDR